MSVLLQHLTPYYEYEENFKHIKTETVIKEELMLSDTSDSFEETYEENILSQNNFYNHELEIGTFVRTLCTNCNRISGPDDFEKMCLQCDEPMIYRCSETTYNVIYSSKRSLRQHITRKHLVTHSFYCCNYCDFTAKTSSALSEHKRKKHRDQLSHICEICGGTYVSVHGLKQHQLRYCSKSDKTPA